MRQINRYGIEIDVCPTSGGIWLDRGELEKLMMLIKEEADSDPFDRPPRKTEKPRVHYDDDDRDEYDDDYRRHKKKGKMSRVMNLFDF
jgi:Zn-finger nucleic acid-binding protein